MGIVYDVCTRNAAVATPTPIAMAEAMVVRERERDVWMGDMDLGGECVVRDHGKRGCRRGGRVAMLRYPSS